MIGSINYHGCSARVSRVNISELMATLYSPIIWVVPGYLPEGFSVMAQSQKLGKTELKRVASIVPHSLQP